MGCDNGQIWYFMGKATNYLAQFDDARIYWSQCVEFYQGIQQKTEQQKTTLVRALLSFQSPTEEVSLSNEVFHFLRQAVGLARESADPVLRREALTAYEFACRNNKAWKSLIETSMEMAELTEQFPRLREEYVLALTMEGQGYVGIEDFESAMRAYKNALKSAEQAGLRSGRKGTVPRQRQV